MKKYIFLICLSMILNSCAKTEDSFKGTYGMVDYFSPTETHKGYAYPFLLEIGDSTAVAYGTMPYWGTPSLYTKNGDTLQFNGKFFKDNRSEHNYRYETVFNGKRKLYYFRKFDGLDTIINKNENIIDSKELASYLNKCLFDGNYMYDGKTVMISGNGSVKGIDEFSTFTTLPRLGTLTNYDDCIIETDKKDIWKYEFRKEELVLIKYTDKRDSWEHYILSDKQIRLKKAKT